MVSTMTGSAMIPPTTATIEHIVGRGGLASPHTCRTASSVGQQYQPTRASDDRRPDEGVDGLRRAGKGTSG